MNSSEFQAHVERIDGLAQRLSAISDEDGRSAALELLRAAMDLHGAAFARIVEVLSHSGEAGRGSLARLGGDPLVCGLMVLYGVHPVPLDDRVKRAVERAAPRLGTQDASVELVSISEGRVRIRARGHGCAATAALKRVEQAILESAPEVVEVVALDPPSSASGFVPVGAIQSAHKEDGNYEESAT